MAHLVLYHGLEGLDELEDVHTTNADAALDYDASEPSNASEAEDSAARSDPGTGGTSIVAVLAFSYWQLHDLLPTDLVLSCSACALRSSLGSPAHVPGR